METKLKFVTAYVGARDSYKVSESLCKGGLLAKHYSDFIPKGVFKFLVFKVPFLNMNGLRKRISFNFPDSYVVNSAVFAFFFRILKKKFGIFHYPPEINFIVGRKAVVFASKNKYDIFLYSYSWMGALEQLRGFSGKKVLFQLHPLPSEFRKIGLVGDGTNVEYEETMSSDEEYEYIQSIKLADKIICASTFVKNGLVENGIKPEKVDVVPYTYQFTLDDYRERDFNSGPLKILYVGSIIKRKCVDALIEAVSFFSTSQVELCIVTQNIEDSYLIEGIEKCGKIVISPSDEELSEIYYQSHVFCLPSKLEGFGLVYSEALCRGIPIIGTVFSGAPDLIENGKQGFVLNEVGSSQIKDIINAYLDDKDLVNQQSKNIRVLIDGFSNGFYESNIIRSVKDLL